MTVVETPALDPIETTVLADAIEDRFAREYALDRLDRSSFTSTLTQMVWARLVELHETGQPVIRSSFPIATSAWDATTARSSGVSDIVAVDLLRTQAWRRRLAQAATALADDALDPTIPPDRLARWSVDSLPIGAPFRPEALPTLDSLADEFGNAPYDWVIPKCLERGDRLVLVAREGSGKSTLFRMWGYQASCGVNWLDPQGDRIDPLRVLVIDAENSARQTGRAVRRLQTCARHVTHLTGGYASPRVLLESSLDLTRPVWRDRIEGHLETEQPDLVILGPLYKVFSFRSALSYEENATQAASIIDDWRNRYGFAVVIEAHASKNEDDAKMDPRGSGVWRGWPEFGRQLAHDKDNGAWRFGQFRGDRDIRDWPDWWFRNDDPVGWPWVPAWGDYPPPSGMRAVAAVGHVQTAWDGRRDLEPAAYGDEPF